MDKTTIRNLLLMRGKTGGSVPRFKQALRGALGEAAAAYAGLSAGDGFDADTETALRAWQSSVGLVADGIAGPRTLAALGVAPTPGLALRLDVSTVSKLFPFTRTSNINRNLPYVSAALAAFGITELNLVCAALGTIRAETEGFVPIAEMPSHFNTLPGQAAFGAYDNRLGNDQPGDGARFRGRGFVQLTGRENYEKYGELLDVALADHPDAACAPEVAACLLAAYLDANRAALIKALDHADLAAARRVVNGGRHGLDRFTDAYRRGQSLLADTGAALVGATASGRASARRATLNVRRDVADLRDRPYVPPPRSLPAMFPADHEIAQFIGPYTEAGLILDQGEEGACTGFGLACVVNYLRWKAAGRPTRFESVSPRMLYHFARRFDEYQGEDYEGSSCRGALKGWYNNGVCLSSKWRYQPGSDSLPDAGWDADAIEQTLGVYYRIDPRAITDMQAAIQEVGAIYVSSYTHKGWDRVKTTAKPPASHAALPVIDYAGKPSRIDGHAYALVGFNRTGFVIQNSWGKDWGAGGFAVITYADWLAHALDVWVAALGVPGIVAGRLASSGKLAGGPAAAAHTDWWDEARAYRHSIVLGNNGRVNRYGPQDAVTRTLQYQAAVLPDQWFRSTQAAKKRLVVYAHGGLNSEDAAIARARAMGRYFLGNGCYPLFLVWKSGLLESFADLLADRRPEAAGRVGGVAEWASEKLSDPLIEKNVGRKLARPLWSEMKENAVLASEPGRGADLLADAIGALKSSWGDDFELHLLGHSAGSIMLGRWLDRLAQKGLADCVRSVQLYAPACTVEFANRYYAPHVEAMKNLHLDVLSEQRERDDNVAGIYRKSLLYFVSNALEGDPRTPILGLENVFRPQYAGWDGSSTTGEALANWRHAVELYAVADRLTVHDEARIVIRRANGDHAPELSERASHGGFDNDIAVIGKTLQRITGGPLALPVSDLAGF